MATAKKRNTKINIGFGIQIIKIEKKIVRLNVFKNFS